MRGCFVFQRMSTRPKRRRAGRLGSALVALVLGLAPLSASTQELDELWSLVDDARLTFERFVRDPDLEWLRVNLKEAKGLLLVPALREGAYVVGVSHAAALFLVQDEATHRWSEPAFYRAVGGSVGLQIGLATSEALVLVMTERGKQSLLSTSVVLGPAVTIAVGPVGRSVGAGVSSALAADFVTYARSKGALGSLALGGTLVAVRDDAHHIYYGRAVTPEDILLAGTVGNWYSARLRKALTTASGGQWVAP